jgi:hypothetical protein
VFYVERKKNNILCFKNSCSAGTKKVRLAYTFITLFVFFFSMVSTKNLIRAVAPRVLMNLKIPK